VKFRAIEALTDRYPVAPMCRLLRVSRSGFYAWQQRPPSAREMANRRLSKEIRAIHHHVKTGELVMGDSVLCTYEVA